MEHDVSQAKRHDRSSSFKITSSSWECMPRKNCRSSGRLCCRVIHRPAVVKFNIVMVILVIKLIKTAIGLLWRKVIDSRVHKYMRLIGYLRIDRLLVELVLTRRCNAVPISKWYLLFNDLYIVRRSNVCQLINDEIVITRGKFMFGRDRLNDSNEGRKKIREIVELSYTIV